MKRIFTMCAALCTLMTGFGQVDTTAKKQEPDTIKVGGMVIIREKGEDYESRDKERSFRINPRKVGKKSLVSTNWLIMDLGFSNYTDKTDYAALHNSGLVDNNIGKDEMQLRTWKSRNVNIWLFMQRISLVKHYVNFKYGLGLELNNYFYDDRTIQFEKHPFHISQSYPPDLKKNKLAADYITMPFMLNINFVPHKYRPYGISAGVSIGYLYSARQKIKEDDGNKTKVKGIDLDEWKLSYVGEVSLGIIKIYGSYAMESMFDKNINITPWTVGLRFSNW